MATVAHKRVLDGFLAGCPTERLLPGPQKVDVNPLEQLTVEIEF